MVHEQLLVFEFFRNFIELVLQRSVGGVLLLLVRRQLVLEGDGGRTLLLLDLFHILVEHIGEVVQLLGVASAGLDQEHEGFGDVRLDGVHVGLAPCVQFAADFFQRQYVVHLGSQVVHAKLHLTRDCLH